MRRTSPAAVSARSTSYTAWWETSPSPRADAPDQRVGVGVRVGVHRGQHGHPRPGHPQVGLAQQVLELCGVRHRLRDGLGSHGTTIELV